jgi:hypothetical protein
MYVISFEDIFEEFYLLKSLNRLIKKIFIVRLKLILLSETLCGCGL